MSVLSRIAGGLKRAFEPAQRINLEVPFAQKEQVKRLGARWDPQQRVWFINSKFDLDKFAPWISGNSQRQRIYLAVPFEEKDEVRTLGASWDAERRAWFIPTSVSKEPFSRWRRTVKAVVVDPFSKTVSELILPTYEIDEDDDPLDVAEYEKQRATFKKAIDPNGEGLQISFTNIGDGCVAIVDDIGLLRHDAAFWEIAQELVPFRQVRGGRYVIYGFDGSPLEADLPAGYRLDFWQTAVRWVDEQDAIAWLAENGLERYGSNPADTAN